MSRRIGIFAHSTNPRGGVVHAMQLAEALCDSGERAVLLAPALPGGGFFRAPRCDSVLIPATPASGTAALVERRITEISRFLEAPGAPRFDIHHAQDPITANALADLAQRGRINGFVRTVHHLDRFDDPRLEAWQDRGMRAADALCCVSKVWQDRIAERTGIRAVLVGNGVDMQRFSPIPDRRDAALRARLGLRDGPVFLALGGIEARKNTIAVLRAFLRLRATHPAATLLIAGGASLLDHTATRALFEAQLGAAGGDAVIVSGIVPDADMPALYRLATAVVSLSCAEGFGLVALEAMACGRPALVSAIAPFTEHFAPGDCIWADPQDESSILDALHAALEPGSAHRLAERGPQVAARFDWMSVAAAHAPLYAAISRSCRQENMCNA